MNILDKGIRVFVASSGLILITAALIRFMIAAGHSQILTMPTLLLGFPLRYALVGIGVVELVAGLYCLFGKSAGTRLGLLMWLMSNWALLKIGFHFVGVNLRETCFGILTDPLRLSRTWVEQVGAFLPFYLFAGAYVLMLLAWLCQRRQRKSEFLKAVCPGCGGHIEFPPNGIGWKISCPHCGGGVRLQKLPQIV
jgi:hypothetical protein